MPFADEINRFTAQFGPVVDPHIDPKQSNRLSFVFSRNPLARTRIYNAYARAPLRTRHAYAHA